MTKVIAEAVAYRPPTMMHRALLCLLALLPMVAPAVEVDVYLLAGQSNMQGLGKLADLTEAEKEPVAGVSFWYGKVCEPLVAGQTYTSTRPGEFGPEIGFARELAPVKGAVTLMKYDASGMPLHHGWNGARWLGGEPAEGRVNFYPGTGPDDPNQGTLYRAMLKRFRGGIEALRKRGDQPVIRGFVWMQGEADAKSEESATSYPACLARLRGRLAQDLGVTVLPMAFGQVLPHEPALPRFTFRAEIRRQMAAADGGSGKPEAIPQARMVSTDGFPMLADTVHYDTRGQLRLGVALAKALREAAE